MKKVKLSLEEFTSYMEFLQKLDEKQDIFIKALNTLSPDTYNDCFLYSEVKTKIIKLLSKLMNIDVDENDLGNDISYFIYELDYGKVEFSKEAVEDNGKVIDLSNIKKLYKYITKKVKEK